MTKNKIKIVVEINLNEETFTPGKKNYERVRSCLENNLKQKFDVVLSWDPPGNIFIIFIFLLTLKN